jgi:methylmalonyl-CoA/ethylmalonyl-CoA epimerase
MSDETQVHLDRIGQVAIAVSDVARARDFYARALGMKFLFDAGNLVFLQCGDVRLMISKTDKPVTPGAMILYFRVEDLEAAYAQIEQRGAAAVSAPHLVAKMPDHDLWMAFIKDPDGHAIGLMCEKPSAA